MEHQDAYQSSDRIGATGVARISERSQLVLAAAVIVAVGLNLWMTRVRPSSQMSGAASPSTAARSNRCCVDTAGIWWSSTAPLQSSVRPFRR